MHHRVSAKFADRTKERGNIMPKQKYLCIQRSQSGKSEKLSPAQMEEMYAKFHAWKEKFQKNIVRVLCFKPKACRISQQAKTCCSLAIRLGFLAESKLRAKPLAGSVLHVSDCVLPPTLLKIFQGNDLLVRHGEVFHASLN